MTKPCIICKTDLGTNHNLTKYCSQKCRNIGKDNWAHIIQMCKICKKEFKTICKTTKYCSRKCASEGHKLKNRVCNVCHKRKLRKCFGLSPKKGGFYQIRHICKDCSNRGLYIKTPEQYINRLMPRIKTQKPDFDTRYLIKLYNEQKGLCAISNIPMTHLTGNGPIDTNISMDRIDNNKGYAKDNIHLICLRINKMKSNLSLEDFKYFCQKVIE
jgi:hypothetical protein